MIAQEELDKLLVTIDQPASFEVIIHKKQI